MKKFLIGLLIVVAVLAVIANIFLGGIVKTAVETVGPVVLGVPVKLQKAEFRLLRGHITLKGFELGNPEGFKTDKAIGVGEVTVDFRLRTILSKTFVIKRIYVNAPDINYELGLGTSNIGKILDGLSKKEEGEEKKKPEEKKEGGKKVIIEDLLIEHGMVKIAAQITGGVGAPIPLPPIHMTDVGKDEGGASVSDVIGKVFGAIFSSITGVVTGAGKLVGEGAEAVGGAAVEGVEAVGHAAGSAVKSIGGLFGGEKKQP